MKHVNAKEQELCLLQYKGMYTGDAFAKCVKIKEEESSIEIPENLTIVTCSTEPLISPLIVMLKGYNIPFINKAEEYKGEWDNTSKAKFIAEGLKEVTTEYTLVLDADNVILLPNLKNILELFKKKDKRVLFAATANRFPNHTIDVVKNRDLLGKFCWLSSGMVIGYTEDICVVYDKIVIIQEHYPDTREQEVCREIFNYEQDTIGFNHECDIFYTLSFAHITEEEDKIIYD